MCWCRTRTQVILFAAVNSVIQSAACVAFGIVALLMYKCVVYPTPVNVVDPTVPQPLTAFANSFYLQYFHSQNNCISKQVDFWRDINDTKTGVVTKSYQVHGMFIGYVADNGLWLITSLLLLIVGVATQARWLYVIHSISQFLVMLYDCILIVLFALDFQSYREFLGNPSTPWITKDTMLVNIIVMLLIVSRFVFFFIINITTFVMMWTIIRELGKPPKTPPFNPNPPPAPILVHAKTRPLSPPAGYGYPQQPYKQPLPPPHHGPSRQDGHRRYPDVVSESYGDWNSYPGQRPTAHQTSHHNRRPPPSKGQRQSGRYVPNEDYDSGSLSSYDSNPPATRNQHQLEARQMAPGSRYPAAAMRRPPSSSTEVLKNQRPWSYISPDELPHNRPDHHHQQQSHNLNPKYERTSASARNLANNDEWDDGPTAGGNNKKPKSWDASKVEITNLKVQKVTNPTRISDYLADFRRAPNDVVDDPR